MNKKITHKNDLYKSHTLNKTKSKQNRKPMLQTGGVNPPKTWFKDIFGFEEMQTPSTSNIDNHFNIETIEESIKTDDMLSSIALLFSNPTKKTVEKHTLICDVDGLKDEFKRQYIGMFDRPTLAELNKCIKSAEYVAHFKTLESTNIRGGLTFNHIITSDVALLHCEPSNAGAVFQVASQFNCLEMFDNGYTPNMGVTIYSNDRTQGPACAMACPAALVYRNYFVKHTKNGYDYNGQCEQQIDNLEDIDKLLKNTTNQFWIMRNGYVIIDNVAKLEQVSTEINKKPSNSVRDALRVGVHWSTSVVDNTEKKLKGHQVCQVYASALPVSTRYNTKISYTHIDTWTDFATCILDGSYMATLCIAALIALKSQKRINCYLTLIGGGAFGNKPEWIIAAIQKALQVYAKYPIDVNLVHFNPYSDKVIKDAETNPNIKNLIDAIISDEYKTGLPVIERKNPIQPPIASLHDKCGSSNFDITNFLKSIDDNDKTIKEIIHPTTNIKMNLYAIKGSVVDFKGDVMVNAANEKCTGGGGIDEAVNISGGELLINAREALPIIEKPDIRCPTGDAKTTIGGNLKTCLCIHAVGPNYNSYNNNDWVNADLLLYSAYFNSMKEAYNHGCKNIAFSLLSSSLFRGEGPKDRGLTSVIKIGILAVLDFANIFGNVVDVFFYGFSVEEYDTLVKIFNIKYDEFIESIKSINNAEIIKFTNAQKKTDPSYNTLQLAYEGLPKGTEAASGEAASGEAASGEAASGEAGATAGQVEIFTKFKSRLDNYKPENLDPKDYGQYIDFNTDDHTVYGHYAIDYLRTRRVIILIDTLLKFKTNTVNYYGLAKNNMLRWCKHIQPRSPHGLTVIVEEMDWGEMALKCTKEYGSIFACLNMANQFYPGGGYTSGPAAQEENMFRRTNCHFSIDRTNMLDANTYNNDYKYKQSVIDLISAKHNETYLDVNRPIICIKDKETWTKTDGNTEKDTRNIGYNELSNGDKFLFYELRCAAVDMRKAGMQFNEAEMKKRIEAQFTTLISKNVRHVVFGAFGCGAFANPPQQVATLYKECIMLYKDKFDVIAFPIYYAGNGESNYPVFRKILLNNPQDDATNSIFYKDDPIQPLVAPTGPKIKSPAASLASGKISKASGSKASGSKALGSKALGSKASGSIASGSGALGSAGSAAPAALLPSLGSAGSGSKALGSAGSAAPAALLPSLASASELGASASELGASASELGASASGSIASGSGASASELGASRSKASGSRALGSRAPGSGADANELRSVIDASKSPTSAEEINEAEQKYANSSGDNNGQYMLLGLIVILSVGLGIVSFTK